MRYIDFCHRRRLDTPLDRPDFLTQIGKAEGGNEGGEQVSKVQMAAHSVDFM